MKVKVKESWLQAKYMEFTGHFNITEQDKCVLEIANILYVSAKEALLSFLKMISFLKQKNRSFSDNGLCEFLEPFYISERSEFVMQDLNDLGIRSKFEDYIKYLIVIDKINLAIKKILNQSSKSKKRIKPNKIDIVKN